MHFATDHQTGLQDLQDQHDEKRLTLIGSRQSEPPLGVRPETDSIKMSETAESFHETLRSLCVFCASAVYMLSYRRDAEDAEITQRIFRFLAIISFSQGWRRPGKRSHIYFFVSPGFED